MAAQFEHTSSEDDEASDTKPFSDMAEAYRELSKRFMVKLGPYSFVHFTSSFPPLV